jgi:hypothetical protein
MKNQMNTDVRNLFCLHLCASDFSSLAKILFLFLLTALCPCDVVNADSLSLPLDGYFHPGRAMPVSWQDSQSIQLSAKGAITTRVDSVAQSGGVFPWIVIGSNVGDVSDRDLPPLHALDESDALVASVGEDDSEIPALFPGRRIVRVHLEPDEIRGPAMAWETLDGLVLSAEAWARLSQSMRAGLFAEGIEVIVPADPPPGSDFDWKKAGKVRVLSANLNFPPIINADAYLPTEGWTAGRDEGFRRHILFSGTIFSLVVSGIGLWRSRWMPTGVIAISIAAGAAFALANEGQSPISVMQGTVRLIVGENQFEDRWVYQISHRDVDFRLPVDGSIQPVFFESSQADRAKLTMECDGNGNAVAISGRLSADEPLVIMSRTRAPIASSALVSATSPLRLLANTSIYAGFTVAGQSGTVLVLRKN